MALNRRMRLFGLPYQFPESVDPREPDISNIIGRNFVQNIISSAPVLTIIPGKPKYLKEMATEDRNSIALDIINGASETLDPLKAKINEAKYDKKKYRFYDFKRTYTEYMKYVNILCRACASLLDIDAGAQDGMLTDEDGDSYAYSFGKPYTQFDWKNYRYTTDKYQLDVGSMFNIKTYWQDNFGEPIIDTTAGAIKQWWDDAMDTLIKGHKTVSQDKLQKWESSNAIVYATDDDNSDDIEDDEGRDLYQNCVQFYISADNTTVNETMDNESSESQIASMITDQVNSLVQEIKFVMGGDTGKLGDIAGSLTSGLTDGISSILSGLGLESMSGISAQLSSYLNSVANGDNIIFPKIYQKSDYSKTYSFEVTLRAVYGCRLGYYLDILVPLMHLIALALPHQTSNNSYTSPFLIKAFCEGYFTCNMGLISSISIDRSLNSEAFNSDNVPNEMTVKVDVIDLLSELMITPQSDPVMFLGNSSLIEYLSTMCGLSLFASTTKSKFELAGTSIGNMFTDILPNIGSRVSEQFDEFVTNFFSLTR